MVAKDRPTQAQGRKATMAPSFDKPAQRLMSVGTLGNTRAGKPPGGSPLKLSMTGMKPGR